MKFIKISDGSEYSEKFPEFVSCIHTDERGFTKIESARIGDENYNDILITYMFSQGYVVKDKGEKGGAGSGNFGHAGRPGEVGGSAPQSGISAGVKKRSVKRVVPKRNFKTPVVRPLKQKPVVDAVKPKKKMKYNDYIAQVENNTSLVLLDLVEKLEKINVEGDFSGDVTDVVEYFSNNARDIKIKELGKPEEILREFSSDYRNHEIEYAFVVDPNTGDIVLTKSGDYDSVSFEGDEVIKLEKNLLIHNHPMKSPLSEQDIFLAIHDNLKGIMCTSLRKKYKDGVFSSEEIIYFMNTNDVFSDFSGDERANIGLRCLTVLKKCDFLIKRTFLRKYKETTIQDQRDFIEYNHVSIANNIVAKIFGFKIDEVVL